MVIVLMGVSGSGKSTLGHELAERLGWPFFDGDDEHPPANVAKMRTGIALTAADRAPWARSLAARVRNWLFSGANAVLACSALTRAIRSELAGGDPRVRFVYLSASKELLRSRLESRVGHFMPASLLESQIETLEEPENAIRIEVSADPKALAAQIAERLKL